MKTNVPLLVGLAVVVAGLGALVLWKPAPTIQELTAPSMDKVRADMKERGKAEGKDYIAETPVILRQTDDEMIVRIDVKLPTGEQGREYHRQIQTEDGWGHDRDLGKSFRDFVEREKRASCERLGKTLAERYQAAVDIPADQVRIAHRLRESTPTGTTDTLLIGSIEVRFRDSGGEGRYVEDFHFVKGEWTMEGTRGQLFDRGPRGK